MTIEPDRKSPVAVSILSLSLLLPLATGALRGPADTIVRDAAAQIQAKQITVVDAAGPRTFDHRALTVTDVTPQGAPRPDLPPGFLYQAPADGATVYDWGTIPVTIRVDGVERTVTARNVSVRKLLAQQKIAVGVHDRVTPAIDSTVVAAGTIEVTHVRTWLERILTRITPPVAHKYDVSMVPGTARVIDAGASGERETTIAVSQPEAAAAPKRLFLAARVLRLPRIRILAEGVGDGIALSQIARRGFVGTMNLADAALRMIATAYTANCSGCSGRTASGRRAGHGIVAVDPRIIPLGSHLFIPGYGHAYAGDTGGAIHGNRIDLGFDSNRDARSFGRRPIVVYVFR